VLIPIGSGSSSSNPHPDNGPSRPDRFSPTLPRSRHESIYGTGPRHHFLHRDSSALLDSHLERDARIRSEQYLFQPSLNSSQPFFASSANLLNYTSSKDTHRSRTRPSTAGSTVKRTGSQSIYGSQQHFMPLDARLAGNTRDAATIHGTWQLHEIPIHRPRDPSGFGEIRNRQNQSETSLNSGRAGPSRSRSQQNRPSTSTSTSRNASRTSLTQQPNSDSTTSVDQSRRRARPLTANVRRLTPPPQSPETVRGERTPIQVQPMSFIPADFHFGSPFPSHLPGTSPRSVSPSPGMRVRVDAISCSNNPYNTGSRQTPIPKPADRPSTPSLEIPQGVLVRQAPLAVEGVSTSQTPRQEADEVLGSLAEEVMTQFAWMGEELPPALPSSDTLPLSFRYLPPVISPVEVQTSTQVLTRPRREIQGSVNVAALGRPFTTSAIAGPSSEPFTTKAIVPPLI